MKLTANRNKLLTSHNIESKIKHYKLLLKEYKKPIDDLSEFPFQDLFDKALVNERNDIEFILNPFNTLRSKSTYSFPEIITPYKIRKTLFETTSKISPIITTSIHDPDEIIEYTTDPELIEEKFRYFANIVINGGYGNNEASTIVDCTGDEITIVRQGLGQLEW